MRRVSVGLAVVGVFAIIGAEAAFAQQRQLRPVTVTYRGSAVQRIQWSPDAPNSASTSSGDPSATGTVAPGTVAPGTVAPGTVAPGTVAPGLLPGGVQQTSVPSSSVSNGNRGGFSNEDLSQRPTLQQLQNPSGGFQLTHSNFTSGQYTSPNNYLGTQYNSWNNLQAQPGNLSLFESFNRNQPATNSGAYFSPNTYIGSVNNQWNNLSSGTITPNYLGSWIYQP